LPINSWWLVPFFQVQMSDSRQSCAHG